MFQSLIDKFKALFQSEHTPSIEVEDIFIGILQTKEVYPSGEFQHEMYYSGFLVENCANEWSLAVLASNVLAARYDILDDMVKLPLTQSLRSTFTIKHSRSVDLSVGENQIVRFHVKYFNDKEKLARWFVKNGHQFASDAANAFVKRIGA